MSGLEELEEDRIQDDTGREDAGDEGETSTPQDQKAQDQKAQDQKAQNLETQGDAREAGMTAVLSTTGSKATIGVRRDGTDVFLEAFDNLGIDALVEELPGVLARAQAQWEDSPLYPKYKKPVKPRARQGNRRRTGAPAAAPAAAGAEGAEEERAPEAAQPELKLF